MIVFSAITPHSPLLLGSINKEKLAKVEKTRQAMAKLADELYACEPDTIIIISSHGVHYDDAFSLNLHEHYRVDLAEFGDLASQQIFYPDVQLIDTIQRSLRRAQQPLTLTGSERLDYGAAVPLLLLTEQLKRVKIIPLSYSGLSPKEHFQFGQALKDVLINSHKRIAVIASGDQSHALITDSPAGFAKQGTAYDTAVQNLIVNKNTAGLLSLDADDVETAKECSYLAMLMLFGVMEQMIYDPVIHSYEAPFGVGYLVAHFEHL